MSQRLMQLWSDLLSIAESITSVDDCASISGPLGIMADFHFSLFIKLLVLELVQALYSPALWQIKVPPRIHTLAALYCEKDM